MSLITVVLLLMGHDINLGQSSQETFHLVVIVHHKCRWNEISWFYLYSSKETPIATM